MLVRRERINTFLPTDTGMSLPCRIALSPLDVYVLINRGDLGFAWLYIVVSVLLSVGAFFAAISLFRYLLS